MSEQFTLLKFYTDTHIAKAIAIQLRNRGVDIVRCEDVDMAEADDYQHLEYATIGGRALVSHDRDFLRIHGEWQLQAKQHAGIFFVQPDLQGRIGSVVKLLMEYYELIKQNAGTVEEDIVNRVTYIG